MNGRLEDRPRPGRIPGILVAAGAAAFRGLRRMSRREGGHEVAATMKHQQADASAHRPHRHVGHAVVVGIVALGLGCTRFGAADLQHAQTALRPELVLQVGHAGVVSALVVSPNGRFVASGGQDRTVKIWDTRSRRLWRTMDGDFGFVRSLAFSPDNRLIAAGSGNAIRLADVIAGSHIRTLEPCDRVMVTTMVYSDFGYSEPSQVTSIAFGPDGDWLASACDGDAAVTLWDVTTGRRIRTIPALSAPAGGRPSAVDVLLPGAPDGVRALAVSPDGQWLATATRDRALRVWDVATSQPVFELAGQTHVIDALAFSADSRFLAVSDGRTATLWQLPNGTAVHRMPGHSIAISPDQRWLTATSDGTIRIWNIAARSDEDSRTPRGSGAAVLSPDGRFLIAMHRGAPTLTDMATGQAAPMLDVAPATWRVAISPDGRSTALQPLFSNDPRARITLWRTGTDRFLPLPGPPGGGAAVFSADGRLLAGISGDRTIRVWDVSSGRAVAAPSSPSTSVSRLALSPDGRWIATVENEITAAGRADRVLRLWDAATGDPVRAEVVTGLMPEVAFSPDSRRLAASTGGIISIREVESGREVRALDGTSPFIFGPDGRFIVTAAGEQQLRVWDLATGRAIRTFPHGGRVMVILAISPDGRWLVTRGWQQEGVTLWDLTTGRDAGSFAGHSPGFSAGGQRVSVTAPDGTIRFRHAQDGTPIASLVFIDDSTDWVVAANDGRIDGSDAGLRQLVSWRLGDAVHPADRFLADYHTPGLLDQILDGR